MSVLLSIKDETATGKITNKIDLEFENNIVTVREIITGRVTAEVDDYNEKLPEHFRGLVQPNNTEATLNGYKMKKKQVVDSEKQVLLALDAFNKNGFFVLIDNIQAESLDQMIMINDKTAISFVKLTPLVGG